MTSNTGVCKGGRCSNEQCCEKSKYGPRKACYSNGDPHVTTFDGVSAERLGRDVFKQGEYYLVNSPQIQIQARLILTNGWRQSAIGEVMVKGAALGGKLLHFMQGGGMRFGNQQVSSGFSDDHIVVSGSAVTFKKDLSVAIASTWAGGCHNVHISMNQRPGVNGFCGNMNGNQADDGQFVNNDASRVRNSLWGHPMVVAVPPPVKKCEGALKQQAIVFCDARIEDKRSDKHANCVFDHCVGGADLAGVGLDFLVKVVEDVKKDQAKDKLEGTDR